MDLGLVRWEDNNQLMILFHPEGTTLTALYRRLSDVKPEVREIIEEQGREKLRDYFTMSDAELRDVLANICGKPAAALGPRDYVLTPDNFLKIAMLITRVQAGIPIVIMGETGADPPHLPDSHLGYLYIYRAHAHNLSPCVAVCRLWQDVADQLRSGGDGRGTAGAQLPRRPLGRGGDPLGRGLRGGG
jgi:hypothetical protein